MKNKKGFTTIELVVVIAIIAILAAIIMVNVSQYRNKGRNSAIRADLGTLYTKGVEYFTKNGNYAGFCTSPDAGGFVGTAINVANVGGHFSCNCDIDACGEGSSTWCACSPEFETSDTSAGSVFCADSTGVKKEAADTTCAAECPADTAVCQ